jgi:hypothetical protein
MRSFRLRSFASTLSARALALGVVGFLCACGSGMPPTTTARPEALRARMALEQSVAGHRC